MEEDKPEQQPSFGIPYVVSRNGKRFRCNRRLIEDMIRKYGDTSLAQRVIVERVVPQDLLMGGFILVGQSQDGNFLFGARMKVPENDTNGTLLIIEHIVIDVMKNFHPITMMMRPYASTRPIKDMAAGMSSKNEMCVIATCLDKNEASIWFNVFSFTHNIQFMLFHANETLIDAGGTKGRRFAVTPNCIVTLCGQKDAEDLKVVLFFLAQRQADFPPRIAEIHQIRPAPTPTEAVRRVDPNASVTGLLALVANPIEPNNSGSDTVFLGRKDFQLWNFLHSHITEKFGTNFELCGDYAADILEIRDNIVHVIVYGLIVVNSNNTKATQYIRLTVKVDTTELTAARKIDYIGPTHRNYEEVRTYHAQEVESLFPNWYQLPGTSYNAHLDRNISKRCIMPPQGVGGYEYVGQVTGKEKKYEMLEMKHIQTKEFI